MYNPLSVSYFIKLLIVIFVTSITELAVMTLYVKSARLTAPLHANVRQPRRRIIVVSPSVDVQYV